MGGTALAGMLLNGKCVVAQAYTYILLREMCSGVYFCELNTYITVKSATKLNLIYVENCKYLLKINNL